MVSGDDEFGPVLRGGPVSGAHAASPAAAPGHHPHESSRQSPPARAASEPPGDEGFGPAVTGRGRRLLGGRRTLEPRDLAQPRDRARPRDQPGGAAPAPPARPGEPPPGAPPRPRRRRRRRPLRVLLTVVLVVVLLLVGSVAALAVYASSRIERVPVGGLQPAPGMNLLVVGSDSRDGLSDEEVTDLGTGRVAGKRADTIFVLSTRGRDSAVLSFPRDLFVTRCDGSQGRINAAFTIGAGPDCLVETVTQVSGIPITGYLEMNFLSFVNVVDAVGGVELCLDEPIRDASAAIDLPAGCQDVDGATALGFVRVRKIDDDLGRIDRQQYFIQQLAREVAEPANVLNVPRLWSTAGAAGGALIADEDFGVFDLARLGLASRGMAAGEARTYVVPAVPQTVGGAAVLVPVEAEAEQLYARFRDGSVLRDPPPAGGDA